MSRHAMRRLSIQLLESRLPMAGNVTVTLQDGLVTITGDDAANGVFITNTGVESLEMEGAPTSINGVPGGSFDFGVQRSIRVQMGGGGDFVLCGSHEMFDLVAELGSGNDSFRGHQVDSTKELIVDGGDGDDSIVMTGEDRLNRFSNTAGTSMILHGGAGGDLVDLVNAGAGLELVVTGGAGSDSIKLQGGTVGNILLINGEADSDRIELRSTRTHVMALHGEAGFNAFIIDHCTTNGGLAVHSGNEADSVQLLSSGAPDYVAFLMGGGSDYMIITQPNTNWLGLFTGDGSDYVVMGGAFDQIYADMGNDHDSLQVVNTTLRQSALFDGGAGGDVFEVINSTFAFRALSNWEVLKGV
jgi:hypothetical protein